MENTLYAFLPCYNEELNISELIDKWNRQRKVIKQFGYFLTIVAIDDCSSDNTKQKMLEKVEQYDNVVLIPHEVNKGLVGGINTALTYFANMGSKDDLMVLMDGDNTHDPVYICEMLNKMQENKDCVIASRYCKESNVVGLARHREFLSDMARFYYRLVLKLPDVEDYTCGYRVYTYDIIQKLIAQFGQEPIKEQSFACMMELLYKLYIVGAVFGEVGFELRYDNKKGKSKMNALSTSFNSITTALNLKKLKKKFR